MKHMLQLAGLLALLLVVAETSRRLGAKWNQSATPPGDAEPTVVDAPCAPPVVPEIWTNEMVLECPGRTETTVAINGIEIARAETQHEWTRDSWAARLEFSPTPERFVAHFAPFWTRAGKLPGALLAEWQRPGVRASFGTIQALRRDLLWELDALSMEPNEYTAELKDMIRAEGAWISDVIGVREAWDEILAEQLAKEQSVGTSSAEQP